MSASGKVGEVLPRAEKRAVTLAIAASSGIGTEQDYQDQLVILRALRLLALVEEAGPSLIEAMAVVAGREQADDECADFLRSLSRASEE